MLNCIACTSIDCDFISVQSSVSNPQVTLSTTFRIPGKTTSATGLTAVTSPSSSSSMLRMQLSSPLLQTTGNPLSSSSASKFSQGPNLLTQLKQQQQQQQQQGEQANKVASKNEFGPSSGLLGKHGLTD